MSKSIKVSEEVYQELLKLQRPRETFSGVIVRLVLATQLLIKVEPIIRGQRAFLEQNREAKEKSQ